MIVTLRQTDDATCELKEVTPATSCVFPVPLGKSVLVAALRTLLAEPEQRDLNEGPVRLDRMRDGIRVNVGAGAFIIAYSHLFPLVLEPAA